MLARVRALVLLLLASLAAVRHVVVRFDAAGVPFGEPRLPDPMVVACEEATPPGSGRWFDARTWAQDFRRALPPGSRCSLRRRGDWQPLAGALTAPPRSTAAPAARRWTGSGPARPAGSSKTGNSCWA